MTSIISVQSQIRLASIVSSLYSKGKTDLAADIIALTASYDGTHVLFDSKNMDSVFMLTLHELLDDLGFTSIMKLSREKAERIAKTPQGLNPQYPLNISPVNER